MSYQVFARKYRPQTFTDVVAQDHVTKTLQNAVKNDRVASGYLFCGPRGTGKTTTARILAKALNCVNGPTPDPCGECDRCVGIASSTSMDVLEIDAASNTGVDDIRALRENVRYLPSSGNKKIYIIDEVHRLSAAAFDALLKTLEEPPSHVVFIFATTEPIKVPETILSRTQRFDFKRVSGSDLAKHLRTICSAEHIEIDDSPLSLLARKADGSVRDSLSLLDQVAAFAGEKITQEDVVDALGLIDIQTLRDFFESIAAKNAKDVLTITSQVIDSGTDVSDFLTELLEYLRQLMIVATDKSAIDLLDLSEDERAETARQAGHFSAGDIIRLMKMTADLLSDLKGGLDERLVLQMGAVKMASIETTVNFEEILTRLNQQPESAPGPKDLFPTAEKKKSEKITIHRPQPETTVTSEQSKQKQYSQFINLPQFISGWKPFLSSFKSSHSMLASQLAMAEAKEVHNNEVLLVFGSHGTASIEVVRKTENLNLITQALSDHFQAQIRLKFELDRSLEHKTEEQYRKGVSRSELDDIVKKSPRLQSLIERVDGEVIGVRKVDTNNNT